jgi:hypothetical protein
MDADLKQHLEAMEGRLNEHFDTKYKGLEKSRKGSGTSFKDWRTAWLKRCVTCKPNCYALSRPPQRIKRSGYTRCKRISRAVPRSQLSAGSEPSVDDQG